MSSYRTDGEQSQYSPETAARSREHRRRAVRGLGIGSGLAVAGGVLAWVATTFAGSDGGGLSLADGINTETIPVTVCDRETINDRMLVSYAGEDGEVQVSEIKSTLFVGGYRQTPEEFYFGLMRGTTYDMTVSGFRIGEAELFKNIVSVEPVDPQPEVGFC